MRKCQKCSKMEGPFVILKGSVLCAKCKYTHLSLMYDIEKQKLENKINKTYLDVVKSLLIR